MHPVARNENAGLRRSCNVLREVERIRSGYDHTFLL
jgi:hypothetical protein